MIILFTILWVIVGNISGLYWWTSEYDFKTEDTTLCLFWSGLGPIAFIAGFFIHSRGKNKTIFKKRG